MKRSRRQRQYEEEDEEGEVLHVLHPATPRILRQDASQHQCLFAGWSLLFPELQREVREYCSMGMRAMLAMTCRQELIAYIPRRLPLMMLMYDADDAEHRQLLQWMLDGRAYAPSARRPGGGEETKCYTHSLIPLYHLALLYGDVDFVAWLKRHECRTLRQHDCEQCAKIVLLRDDPAFGFLAIAGLRGLLAKIQGGGRRLSRHLTAMDIVRRAFSRHMRVVWNYEDFYRCVGAL